MPLTPQQAYALRFAQDYRRLNYNPIPSCTEGRKKPLFAFVKDYGWETMFPESWFTTEAWEQNPTTNLQILCGRHWDLFVVDLDGEEAKQRWDRMGRCPRTWVVHRDGGASFHFWFRYPPNFQGTLKKCFLWRGEGHHQGIELLAEKSLATAPPSLHVETRGMYRFLERHTPLDLRRPAIAPDWLMRMKPVQPERHEPHNVPPPPMQSRSTPSGERLSRNEILDRIPDKVGLAASWGVRFTGIVRDGWAECRSIRRDDNNPSAAMNIHSGVYHDLRDNESIPFFDLMREMGQATDFADACLRLTEHVR